MLLSKSCSTWPPLMCLHRIVLCGSCRSLRCTRRSKPMLHLICCWWVICGTKARRIMVMGTPWWNYLLGMICTATARASVSLGSWVRRSTATWILVLLNVVVGCPSTTVIRWWLPWARMLRNSRLGSLAGQVSCWILRAAIIIVAIPRAWASPRCITFDHASESLLRRLELVINWRASSIISTSCVNRHRQRFFRWLHNRGRNVLAGDSRLRVDSIQFRGTILLLDSITTLASHSVYVAVRLRLLLSSSLVSAILTWYHGCVTSHDHALALLASRCPWR